MFMQTNGKPTDRASLQSIFSYKWFKLPLCHGHVCFGGGGCWKGKGREMEKGIHLWINQEC